MRMVLNGITMVIALASGSVLPASAAHAAPQFTSSYKSTVLNGWHVEPAGELTCAAYTTAPAGDVNFLVSDALGLEEYSPVSHTVKVAIASTDWKTMNTRFGNDAIVSFYFPNGEGPDGAGTFQDIKRDTAGSLGWGYLSTLGIDGTLRPMGETSDLGQDFIVGIMRGSPVLVGIGTQLVAEIDFRGWKDVGPEFEKCLRSWSQVKSSQGN